MLAAPGVQFRVLPYVIVERFQVAESLRLGDDQHLGFDLRHAPQAKLMNLFGGEIAGGLVTHGEAIPRLAIGQGPHAGIDPPVRCVVFSHEPGEFRVRRRDRVPDCAFDPFAQRFPLCLGDRIGKLAQRRGKRTLVERVAGDLLRLSGHLLEQIPRRYAMVAQTVAHMFHRLIQYAWNLSKAARVIPVVFRVAEGRIEG